MIRAFIADRLFDGTEFHKRHAVLVEDGVVLDLVEPGGVPDQAERHLLPAGHTLAPSSATARWIGWPSASCERFGSFRSTEVSSPIRTRHS